METLKRIWGSLLLPGCWFAPASFLRVFFHKLRGVKIERGVEIGYFVIIDHVYPEAVEIEECVVLGPGVKILAHDDAYGRQKRSMASVRIKKGTFVGASAIILPGVLIGSNSVIGAGSLVNDSVAKSTVVGGVPAKKIKDIESDE